MSRLVILPLILCLAGLAGCASPNAPVARGGEPVGAVKSAPLSPDPNSPLNDVRTGDGTVGVVVKEF